MTTYRPWIVYKHFICFIIDAQLEKVNYQNYLAGKTLQVGRCFFFFGKSELRALEIKFLGKMDRFGFF
jgi:hypothetical protein